MDLEQVLYELSRIQKNKATEHYIGNLRAKLSKILKQQTKKRKGDSYAIKKQGDATIALIGFPSVGKSSLLNALTNAKSEVANYEFTTLKPIPGIMKYNKARIQIIDAPGIIEGASKGRGEGRKIISAIRSADLIIIVLDQRGGEEIIKKELSNAGVRINEKPPRIIIEKTNKGGIIIESTVKQEVSEEEIKKIMRAMGYVNAHIIIREKITIRQLIDSLLKNRVYIKAIVIHNKADISKSTKGLNVSAQTKEGLEQLKKIIWNKLELKRIYLKKPGSEPDFNEPLIMRGRITIRDVIKKLKKDYKNARVWGKSVKHQGIKVGLNHELEDEDIITLN